ncbi:hypothetical protein QQF54_20545 [Lelliottia sp. V106_10]|uniref:hypothetical protein n=1 Tax=Lelliottia wanjuensis TaxID=3050585 RepID=UPI002550B86D|nr:MULTISPECIES: hypothetical protein [unclassified Lelliottia]MDK9356413.1 hypothetical protein [Lelliottia sp. V106_16]MDK9375732.1 hypothetical protein [Lelliottia sp. V106_10]MDK9602282.1 hypothetical protein [Lelliottia sp. V106_5]
MWNTIFNWPWATIWAAISAIFTAAAVGVAGWAMLRWRKQDELKVKLAFKQAIGDYLFQLVKMPEVVFTKDIKENENDCEKLTILYHACFHAFVMTEDLLANNEIVNERWESLFITHQRYIAGKCKSNEIDRLCADILCNPFVFGK